MRQFALYGWLLLPLIAGAYHFGPGQDRLREDAAAAALGQAEQLAAAEDWGAAAVALESAISQLPPERAEDAVRLRIERNRAWIQNRKLPEAAADAKALVDELDAAPGIDPQLLDSAREGLAQAQYYMTWLMRLEGMPRSEWEPEIESARQAYKLLAEDAAARGDETTAHRQAENLEAAIRLARMEPGALQGLAIPKPCQGCKSGQCKGKRPGRNPNPGRNKPQDARGASSGPPPDNSGS